MVSRSLYLVRHAIAAERGAEWPDDDIRPLTARGMARFREAVRGLDWVGAELDEIWTSPLVRARQTAGLLSEGLGGQRVRVLEQLAPGSVPAEVSGALEQATRCPRLALVGHEPGLGELAAYLIGAPQPLQFKKGGACQIDLGSLSHPGTGTLCWFLTPRVLRRLAGGRTA